MLEVNLDDMRTVPKTCVLTPISLQQMMTYVELYKPNTTTATVNTSFSMMGAYALNGGIPYAITAGQSYKIAIELWGPKEIYTPKDFSVVTWGEKGPLTIKHTQGFESDQFFNSTQ